MYYVPDSRRLAKLWKTWFFHRLSHCGKTMRPWWRQHELKCKYVCTKTAVVKAIMCQREKRFVNTVFNVDSDLTNITKIYIHSNSWLMRKRNQTRRKRCNVLSPLRMFVDVDVCWTVLNNACAAYPIPRGKMRTSGVRNVTELPLLCPQIGHELYLYQPYFKHGGRLYVHHQRRWHGFDFSS